MKSDKKILFAFILNLAFSIFEFFGGVFTGSAAIISDSVHDLGDAASIGISFILEKKSKKKPDKQYTYGYTRYSVLGTVITVILLQAGSIIAVYNAIDKILNPVEINHNGMIIFSLIGITVNFCAALFTHGGISLNQKAVNLHMLEDVLGWLVVFIGSVTIKFTGFTIIDPIMSVCVSLFIFINTFKILKNAIDILLEKVPGNIDIDNIKKQLVAIDGVVDVHHIHVWSGDVQNIYATLHIVTDKNHIDTKNSARKILKHLGITHATIETENMGEKCDNKHCHIETDTCLCHHH